MNAKAYFLIIVLVGFGLAQPVAAKEYGWYIGAGIGSGAVKSKGTVPSSGDFSFNESDFAWKVFGGYTLGSWLGIEGSYVDFGSGSGSVNSNGDTAKADVTGLDAFAVVGLPVGPLRIFAKLGGIYWDSEVRFDGGTFTVKDDGFDIGGGLGLEFSLFSVAVRAEVEYFAALDDLYLATIGATWTF